MKKLLLFLVLTLLPLPVAAAILEEDVADRVVVWFFDSTTGVPKTGLTVTSITCRIVKSDMSTSSFSPTASGGSNDMVELGHGAYDLELTAAQLSNAGIFEFGCSISGSTSPATAYDIYPTASYARTIGGQLPEVNIATGGLTAPSIASDAFTAAQFSADVSAEFSTDLMATTFEGAHTFKHFLQYGASALFGRYSSTAGVFNFRDLANNQDRIIYTTTETDDPPTARTSVTLIPD